MRNFLFRVWDDEMNVMFDNLTWSELATIKEKCSGFRLMQWTGLKDKKGKLIFEGDIVCRWSSGHKDCKNLPAKHFYGTNNPFSVNTYHFAVKWDMERAEWDLDRDEESDFEPEYFEVIGNIFENTNLLDKDD